MYQRSLPLSKKLSQMGMVMNQTNQFTSISKHFRQKISSMES